MAESYITRKGGGGGGVGNYSTWAIETTTGTKYTVYNGYDFQTNNNPNLSNLSFNKWILNNSTSSPVVLKNVTLSQISSYNTPDSSLNEVELKFKYVGGANWNISGDWSGAFQTGPDALDLTNNTVYKLVTNGQGPNFRDYRIVQINILNNAYITRADRRFTDIFNVSWLCQGVMTPSSTFSGVRFLMTAVAQTQQATQTQGQYLQNSGTNIVNTAFSIGYANWGATYVYKDTASKYWAHQTRNQTATSISFRRDTDSIYAISNDSNNANWRLDATPSFDDYQNLYFTYYVILFLL
jgi:hypothetical protein